MSIEKNVQTVKDFFAAIGRGDREAVLALVAEDIEDQPRRGLAAGRNAPRTRRLANLLGYGVTVTGVTVTRLRGVTVTGLRWGYGVTGVTVTLY